MFTHFIVKNFRCFADLHLQHLTRVNLISGKNNTGKTALLEAIHLHNNPSNCNLPVAINKQRGIREPEKAFSDLVEWLFYRKQVEIGLELSSSDERGTARALSIYLLDSAAARERFPEAVNSLVEALPAGQWNYLLGGLILRYEQAGEPPRFSWGTPNQFGGLMSASARIPWSIPSIYLGSGLPSRDQDVKFFGELEAAKRQAEIVPTLQILDPRLQRLALVPLANEPVVAFSGPGSSGVIATATPAPGLQPVPVYHPAGEPILHGDIGLPRLIPMPLLGEGMRRVLSLVLAIANAPGGVVLIDEIENGLHYSVQKDVWKAIAHAARQANVQVFATTHSWECIEAAHRAFKETGPYELRYYRLDRRGEDILIKSLDEAMLDTVEKSDLEVR
jgi:hypothetical protein